MSDAASKLAPTGRLRVAVYAVDLLRRTALSRVVAEAGHIVVGAQDAADVVLADGDCVLEQGCAGFSPGPADRKHQIASRPWRTSSPLRPGLDPTGGG
jgi:hypothetical protein